MVSRRDENCSRKVEIGWFLEYGGRYIKIIRNEIPEEEIVQSENSKDDTSPDALHFSVKESRQRSAFSSHRRIPLRKPDLGTATTSGWWPDI